MEVALDYSHSRHLLSPKPFFNFKPPAFTTAKMGERDYLNKCLQSAQAEYGAYCYEVRR